MTPEEKLKAIEGKLRAAQEEFPDDHPDDWDPLDYSGGDFADCYEMGREDGISSGRDGLASDLIAEFFKEAPANG